MSGRRVIAKWLLGTMVILVLIWPPATRPFNGFIRRISGTSAAHDRDEQLRRDSVAPATNGARFQTFDGDSARAIVFTPRDPTGRRAAREKRDRWLALVVLSGLIASSIRWWRGRESVT